MTVEDKTWSAAHFGFTADQAAAFYERYGPVSHTTAEAQLCSILNHTCMVSHSVAESETVAVASYWVFWLSGLTYHACLSSGIL